MRDLHEAAWLTIDEIAGTISPSDQHYLDLLILEDQDALDVWELLHSDLGPRLQAEAAESLRMNPAQQVLEQCKNQQRRSLRKKTIIVATVLILIVSTCWYFILRNDSKWNKSTRATTSSSPTVNNK
ncbi:hypothetical protein [Chitinophaga sp. MM2321]|uniref:hypothetical protein n=1 Tax=Chitinophaga sp. MM2321 TaxID=3137178 RepID=UPI0032D5AEB3